MAYAGAIAKIPFGEMGIVTDMPPGQLPPNSFIEAKNITLENGLLEKARGGLRYNATPLSAGIVGLFDYWPDIVQQRLIAVTSDGNVYRDTGDRTFSGGTAIATGLGSLSPNVTFVEGGQETSGRSKKLFLFTEGKNQLKVLAADGISFADIATPAADWTGTKLPKVGIIHRNRFWAFEGQRSYASNTGDHEDFVTSALTQAIYPGEGGEIRGAYAYKGRLFAFKDGGFVYLLNDEATSSTDWYWVKLASNFGLASPNGMLDALDDMLAMNTTGTVTSYVATEKLGDIESADLFRNMRMEQFIHKNLNKGGITEAHALYYPEKKLVYFTYRQTSRTSNDTLIIVDMGQAQPRIYLQTKGTPQCLALRKDTYKVERPVYGDASGYVILMDREDRLESGAAFTMDVQTSSIDFRHLDPQLASVEKHFDFLNVEFIEEGNWNLSCDYFIDGKFVETITFSMFTDPQYLDLFELDEDLLPFSHAKGSTRRIKGTGRSISFRFYQAGSNQSVQLAAISIGIRPGTDRQLRRTS